ncbi:hypothetical protein MKW94_026396 [Papaver nudicaule]|uniref:BHLH domain-containing protein n=1 Tax=Papaver nudicaule TaxID=74823 RepID=A0AA41VXQ3_PAPNU|nr:hypothetical protein [Papaver nudicaule]
MYDNSETHLYFDPHSIQVGGVVLNDPSTVATAALDFQLEQKFDDAPLVPEVIVIDDEPSPVQSGPLDYEPQHQQEQNSHLYQEMQGMQEQNSHYYHQQEQYYQQQPTELQHLSSGGGVLASPSTILPNFSFDIFGETSNHNEVIQGGENGQGSANTSYEHAMSLDLNNFHSESPIFRELFEPPQNYGVSSSMFGGEMDETARGVYQQQQNEADNNGMRQFENLVSDFKRDMNINTHGVGGRTRTNGLGVAGSHGNKHTTRVEKIKREYLSGQYKALSLLVPNPSKPDRASVLASTIDYINELKGTVDYLKILVDKKRNNGDMENSAAMPASSTNIDRDRSSLNGQVRSSWSQRKSKDTEVDVRIIDTDVTIQLIIQRAKMINLLSISRILDELQLDLLHVSSGCIGDYHSFWFNTKILEGSSLYASAIAKKLIEGVEKNYAASITESNC